MHFAPVLCAVVVARAAAAAGLVAVAVRMRTHERNGVSHTVGHSTRTAPAFQCCRTGRFCACVRVLFLGVPSELLWGACACIRMHTHSRSAGHSGFVVLVFVFEVVELERQTPTYQFGQSGFRSPFWPCADMFSAQSQLQKKQEIVQTEPNHVFAERWN